MANTLPLRSVTVLRLFWASDTTWLDSISVLTPITLQFRSGLSKGFCPCQAWYMVSGRVMLSCAVPGSIRRMFSTLPPDVPGVILRVFEWSLTYFATGAPIM
jgi:hypothetical protein